MSLRYQINIRILLLSLVILMLSGSIAIWQARQAVDREVASSLNLALQLLDLGFSIASGSSDDNDWIYRLHTLKPIRHLQIQLRKPSGQLLDITASRKHVEQSELPPGWFIDLVVDDYPEAEYPLLTGSRQPATLIIKAEPWDEITEIWQETITFFSTILLLVIMTMLAVHLMFNKTLQPISAIVTALKGIADGDYRQQLPHFAIREYSSIAAAINRVSDVLAVSQQQNRALMQHSLEIQEDERQRLAQELHDELGQSLTGIKVMAIAAGKPQADSRGITGSIVEICDHLMVVVRSMMQQLHPLSLTELGLHASLEDLLSHWMEKNPQLRFSLHCSDAVANLDQKITIQIFRIVQECLTNIIRHAQASRVEIEIGNAAEDPQRLCLRVQDDGVGCKLDDLKSGFGLLGMRERIKSLDGKMQLWSQPGRGMLITATIPL